MSPCHKPLYVFSTSAQRMMDYCRAMARANQTRTRGHDSEANCLNERKGIVEPRSSKITANPAADIGSRYGTSQTQSILRLDFSSRSLACTPTKLRTRHERRDRP